MTPDVRIAVSGKSGCGNTTVSGLLAQSLGIALVNYTFRTLAAEEGLTLEEITRRARTDDRFDKAVDERQVALAMRGPCVLGSRLAIWLLPQADLRVFLTASEAARVARIAARECTPLEATREFTRLRDAEDTVRFKRLYGIDNNDTVRADIVIDTETLRPPEIAALITGELRRRGRLGA